MCLRLHSLVVLVCFSTMVGTAFGQNLTPVTIAYPNGGFNWPLFIAKEAGYFAKYGLNAQLTFAPHPAGVAMVTSGEAQVVSYSLEQLMLAASRDRSMALIASPINRGMFAMLAWNDIRAIRNLKGRRIGVGQIGDANYGYSVTVLARAGLSAREVTWIPLGPNMEGRAAALISHRIDAAIITAPAYFRLISGRIKILVNFAERRDIFAAAALLMPKHVIVATPEVPKAIIKAESEAVRRFYHDKDFSTKVFARYDRTIDRADLDRLYDLYSSNNAFELIPFVRMEAIAGIIGQQTDPQLSAQMRRFDFRSVIADDLVGQLQNEGFFRELFGVELNTR